MPVTILCVPCKNIYTNLHKFVRQAPNFLSSIYIFISHDKLCVRRILISLLISMTNIPSNTRSPLHRLGTSGVVKYPSWLSIKSFLEFTARLERESNVCLRSRDEVERCWRDWERSLATYRNASGQSLFHSNCLSTSSSKAHSPWVRFVTFLSPCSAV